ncbi:MAG: alkaline phosphatase D family protein [Planctomycetota bacterium]|nr:alkaline phosphatase D family protein [Planctomycetota bacterium]
MLIIAGAALAVLARESTAAGIFHAQGEMAGEVSVDSAIVQSRLTSVDRNVGGEVEGTTGVACFEYSTSIDFSNSKKSEWLHAAAESDYIVKTVLRDLKPATRHYYRLIFGPAQDDTQVGPTCSFRTLQGPAGDDPVSFVVVTGMNYGKFHGDKTDDRLNGWGPSTDPEKAKGFPAAVTMAGMDLDFFVGTGDNVYYDGKDYTAKTQAEMRRKWHEQFVQPLFVSLFRNLPTYWEKDDHDHRYNDCDLAGDRLPLSDLGIATFREQMPVVDLKAQTAKTYRTYRVNRHLQIWLVEGRDYRSQNRMPNGPEKTLWGADQISWLKTTLLESDATFKLLISPTPMVGPDDAYKIDNHVNHNGFRHEGRAFFQWIVDQKLHENGFYVLCGDRHWQYHSRDPMGVEEFSSGALVDANARLGRKPGDPKSTDPNAEIKQFYTQAQPSGGFLNVTVGPGKAKHEGAATFSFVDENGEPLYTTTKLRTVDAR